MELFRIDIFFNVLINLWNIWQEAAYAKMGLLDVSALHGHVIFWNKVDSFTGGHNGNSWISLCIVG